MTWLVMFIWLICINLHHSKVYIVFVLCGTYAVCCCGSIFTVFLFLWDFYVLPNAVLWSLSASFDVCLCFSSGCWDKSVSFFCSLNECVCVSDYLPASGSSVLHFAFSIFYCVVPPFFIKDFIIGLDCVRSALNMNMMVSLKSWELFDGMLFYLRIAN